MRYNITVKALLSLFYGETWIQIYLDGRTYEFDTDEVPECILNAIIDTIDSPEYYTSVHPLCINISDEENNIDGKEFYQTYNNFEI